MCYYRLEVLLALLVTHFVCVPINLPCYYRPIYCNTGFVFFCIKKVLLHCKSVTHLLYLPEYLSSVVLGSRTKERNRCNKAKIDAICKYCNTSLTLVSMANTCMLKRLCNEFWFSCNTYGYCHTMCCGNCYYNKQWRGKRCYCHDYLCYNILFCNKVCSWQQPLLPWSCYMVIASIAMEGASLL